VRKLDILAAAKGVSTAQLGLAWVLAQGVVPIPGTRRRKNLEANVAAAAIVLTPQELADIEAVLPVGSVAGAAYPGG